MKTRLAKDIGEEKAASVSRHLAERIMRNTRPQNSEYGRVAFCSPQERIRDFGAWLGGELLRPQKGEDLGLRMVNALKELFAMGAERAIIVGTDVPDLSHEIIRQAFLELGFADIVLGPAKDGGYYLIGMKSLNPEIFQDIPWETAKVFEETVERAERLGLRWEMVAELSDLDTYEDYLAFERMLLAGDEGG